MPVRLNGSTSGYIELTAPAVAGNQTFIIPDAFSSFPAGTAVLFAQTAAPTGWTKSTTHDDKVLRVVSGAAGSGGTTAFSTVFTSRSASGTVGSTTLTESQIPSHRHILRTFPGSGSASTLSVNASIGSATSSFTSRDVLTDTGGGGSHTHSFTGSAMDFAVQYVDVIIATKN